MLDKDSIGAMHRDIMRRCYDEKYKLYKDYGAKGRKVCDEWHDRDNFRRWSESNGYQKGFRLLRRDTKGDFCPDNCYWGISPTKSYEYGKIKAHKAEIKEYKDRYRVLGVESPSKHPLAYVHGRMKSCCYNPNSEHYKYYGGRGIKICDEWRGKDGLYNFVIWALTEGGYEPGLSIERIDVNGDYCPDNCTFITMYEQAQNKRRNHIFIVNGEKFSAMSFCEIRNIDYNRFMSRYKKGMSINKILDELENKYFFDPKVR